jgi:hypothetical protein
MRSGVPLAKNIPPFVVWCRVTVGYNGFKHRRTSRDNGSPPNASSLAPVTAQAAFLRVDVNFSRTGIFGALAFSAFRADYATRNCYRIFPIAAFWFSEPIPWKPQFIQQRGLGRAQY